MNTYPTDGRPAGAVQARVGADVDPAALDGPADTIGSIDPNAQNPQSLRSTAPAAGTDSLDDLHGFIGAFGHSGWPTVSVVMPVLNEERHLADAVHRILEQDYPGPLEVVLAIGPCKDRTDAVAAQLVAEDPRIRTVPNPTGRTPSALNAAIAASSNEIVVRVDGHGLLTPGYIRTAVQLLAQTGAGNVGGVMHAEGQTDFERAVAVAMTSKLGVGNAKFHTGGEAGPAETVYLGVFPRAVLQKLGGYNEAFVRAQDWELNHRLRQDGGLVYFSPRLQVTYRPRPNLKALATQYLHYGRWRRVVMRTHAGTANGRYLTPPLAVLTVALGLLCGLFGLGCAAAGAGGALPLFLLGWIAPVGYAATIIVGALYGARDAPTAVRLRLPLVLATMHFCWGWGFLSSPKALFESTRPRDRADR